LPIISTLYSYQEIVSEIACLYFIWHLKIGLLLDGSTIDILALYFPIELTPHIRVKLGRAKRIKPDGQRRSNAQVYAFPHPRSHCAIAKQFGEWPQREGLSFMLLINLPYWIKPQVLTISMPSVLIQLLT
jgi:hypothetical protein